MKALRQRQFKFKAHSRNGSLHVSCAGTFYIYIIYLSVFIRVNCLMRIAVNTRGFGTEGGLKHSTLYVPILDLKVQWVQFLIL